MNWNLGPVCTDVWVLVLASPFVEVLRQMRGETATLWKVGLADEDHVHTWRIAALAGFKESTPTLRARISFPSPGDQGAVAQYVS